MSSKTSPQVARFRQRARHHADKSSIARCRSCPRPEPAPSYHPPCNALCRHDMAFHKAKKRIERRADRPHGVGHGRQRDRHAFQSVALGLAVQRLMLAELLEHDHGQQARPRPSPCNDMERRRCLRDLLTVAAGELLPDRLDHLPTTRLRFQGSRHVFAELAQTIAATALTRRRRFDHHTLAGKVIGESVALGTPARKTAHRRCLGDRQSPPQVHLPWRWLPAPRTPAPVDRSDVPNAPIVARTPGAQASRSAASAGRSVPRLPMPWPARPPIPRRVSLHWRAR